MTGEPDLNEGLDLSHVDRFRYRTRYFTDSGIIGAKEFVSRVYRNLKGCFVSRHEKRPKPVHGLDGIYSLNAFPRALHRQPNAWPLHFLIREVLREETNRKIC